MIRCRTAAIAAMLSAASSLALAQSTRPAAPATPQLFPLEDVRLLDGPFKDAETTDLEYILQHKPDRLLAPFRREAGLSKLADPYPNWESQGLDGHTAGHYLSALAMMYASTGDAECKKRLDYMVDQLAECQEANGNGYVGGVPRSKALWTDVAAGKIKVTGFGVNDRWVPWYNMHKLYAGLRDAYLVGHNEKAKKVYVALADWCDELLSHLTDEQVQNMLKAEHGGMAEVLAEVTAITGDPKYLKLAQRFSDHAILDPLIAGRDELTGKHANTQIPKVIGFARISQLNGDESNHKAAEFFWQTVTDRRSVAIGGNSVDEHFNSPDNFKSMVEARSGVETCNTYNMLRLSEQLFDMKPEAKYADYAERAIFNHILSTQDPDHGGFVYFTPMRPQSFRNYSKAEQGFWCCVGTGFENHAKYGRFIYAGQPAADGKPASLYVNLFIASDLNWAGQGVKVRQETKFPDAPSTKLTLKLDRPTNLALSIRHPEWIPAGDAMAIKVNGQPVAHSEAATSYAEVSREWKDGDVIEVSLPMSLTTERLPDKSDYVAFEYGPIVLAAITGKQDMRNLFAGTGRMDHVPAGPLLPLADAPTIVTDDPAKVAATLKRVPGDSLAFQVGDTVAPESARDLTLIPFARVHEARYEIYWPITTPSAYAQRKDRAAAADAMALALDKRTIDQVTPGNQQSEVGHQYAGDRSGQGTYLERTFRNADGWFSYVMKRPTEPARLSVTYSAGDAGRTFDIFVDDQKLASEKLEPSSTKEPFFTKTYDLPAGGSGDSVKVRFAATNGSTAGSVYDVRIVRPESPQAPTTQAVK